MEEIMNIGNDYRVFYRLIWEQRNGFNTLLQTLVMNGTELEPQDEKCARVARALPGASHTIV